MKFYTMIAALVLSGCASTNAWETKTFKESTENISTQSTIDFLKAQGYTDPLITGDRSEDCHDSHTVAGHGVILKVFTQSGAPTAMSAVVCIDWDGNRSLIFDQKQ